MNEEQYAEVKASLASNDTEHGSFRRRLDEHDDKIEKLRGMNIAITTTAKTDEEARELLSLMGAPFTK